MIKLHVEVIQVQKSVFFQGFIKCCREIFGKLFPFSYYCRHGFLSQSQRGGNKRALIIQTSLKKVNI